VTLRRLQATALRSSHAARAEADAETGVELDGEPVREILVQNSTRLLEWALRSQ